ncbi:hypothetical protein KM043_004715 [Ampulex compressa]|nr:hypothetical protein KM043_004715 [Ampulex compressa]
MALPVSIKKQQRHSLSAKKGPIKGLRNVLAQPHDNYWPIVTPDEHIILEDILRTTLPAIKRPSITISRSELQHMRKECSQTRKNNSNENEVPNKDIINSVITGINATTRCLEKNDVCFLLLDAEVEPSLLIRHVILMAESKKVPVLLLPSLKSIAFNTIGYASAAFAFKNIDMQSSNHHFYDLYIKVLEISMNHPPPRNSLRLFKGDDKVMKNEKMEINTESQGKSEVQSNSNFSVAKDVYVYRASCKERTFVPPGSAENTSKEDSMDFISFKDDSDDESNISRNKRSSDEQKDNKDKEKSVHFISSALNTPRYLSLKVRRLQGNGNRVKATKVSKAKKK